MDAQNAVGKSNGFPAYLRIWFGLDLVLALLPPLHWWVNGPPLVDGTAPRVLVYLFGTSTIIAASIVVAVLNDGSTGRGRSR